MQCSKSLATLPATLGLYGGVSDIQNQNQTELKKVHLCNAIADVRSKCFTRILKLGKYIDLPQGGLSSDIILNTRTTSREDDYCWNQPTSVWTTLIGENNNAFWKAIHTPVGKAEWCDTTHRAQLCTFAYLQFSWKLQPALAAQYSTNRDTRDEYLEQLVFWPFATSWTYCRKFWVILRNSESISQSRKWLTFSWASAEWFEGDEPPLVAPDHCVWPTVPNVYKKPYNCTPSAQKLR